MSQRCLDPCTLKPAQVLQGTKGARYSPRAHSRSSSSDVLMHYPALSLVWLYRAAMVADFEARGEKGPMPEWVPPPTWWERNVADKQPEWLTSNPVYKFLFRVSRFCKKHWESSHRNWLEVQRRIQCSA